MHAFLIIGEKDGNTSEAEKIARELKSKIIEFPFAKIGDVNELNKFTRLTLSYPTVIFLRAFDKASEEAQNAFLKSLEEPQANLSYVLSAMGISGVLPTIVSRCEVREVYGDRAFGANELAGEFLAGNVGLRMEIIGKFTKRDEAIDFMNELIGLVHKRMLKEPSLYGVLEMAQNTAFDLKRNGNVVLQLTNFVSLITE